MHHDTVYFSNAGEGPQVTRIGCWRSIGVWVACRLSGTVPHPRTTPAWFVRCVSALCLCVEFTRPALFEIVRLMNNQPPPPKVPTTIATVRFGNTVRLAWPSDYLGCRLESNSVSLTATALWFTVVSSASTNQVALPVDATRTNVFFRLAYRSLKSTELSFTARVLPRTAKTRDECRMWWLPLEDCPPRRESSSCHIARRT